MTLLTLLLSGYLYLSWSFEESNCEIGTYYVLSITTYLLTVLSVIRLLQYLQECVTPRDLSTFNSFFVYLLFADDNTVIFHYYCVTLILTLKMSYMLTAVEINTYSLLFTIKQELIYLIIKSFSNNRSHLFLVN